MRVTYKNITKQNKTKKNNKLDPWDVQRYDKTLWQSVRSTFGDRRMAQLLVRKKGYLREIFWSRRDGAFCIGIPLHQ